MSDFERPITEKLSRDFFNDPSSSSLTCSAAGSVTLGEDVDRSKAGEEVFEESKNLFFKTLRVRRVVDEKSKTLLYVSYNTRLNKNDDSNKSRFKSSICAVHYD